MRRHKVRVAWHKLYKDATSRVSDEPKIRNKALACIKEDMIYFDYPRRQRCRSWKRHRKTQFKRQW